jgi:hypothetical protein
MVISSRISILLPVLSTALVLVVLARPEITGLVTAPAKVIDAEIVITTAGGVILPGGAEIHVSLGGESSVMTVSEFIERSGQEGEIAEGEVPEIGYKGTGYTGNHSYAVPLSEFNISRNVGAGTSKISVEITFNGMAFSGAETEIVV